MHNRPSEDLIAVRRDLSAEARDEFMATLREIRSKPEAKVVSRRVDAGQLGRGPGRP